jgi:ribosome-associated toxin RatA of RatAB toxin-antitoxin module
MKELSASASATVAATPEACTQLLAAVDRYPDWYPDVIREAEVLERAADGTPERVRATVHVALGPIARDFRLVLLVAVEPGRRVTLSRVPHEPPDEERFELAWNVDVGPPTTLRLELAAQLEVPRFLPVGGVGAPLAQGFVDAARRALDGSSPNASASSS